LFAVFFLTLHQSTGAAGGWVDPDSPEKAKTTKALADGDDRQFELVSLAVAFIIIVY